MSGTSRPLAPALIAGGALVLVVAEFVSSRNLDPQAPGLAPRQKLIASMLAETDELIDSNRLTAIYISRCLSCTRINQ